MFERHGTPWPEADLTFIDLATYAREGYNAQHSLAYISLINTVRITKLGAWFWLATQTLDDQPKAAEPLLNMMAWRLYLSLQTDEVKKIAAFAS